MSTVLALGIPVASPAPAAIQSPRDSASGAAPRALAPNEVLGFQEISGIGMEAVSQSSTPLTLTYQKIEYAVGSTVTAANRAKVEKAISTLACAGKPKLACTVTVDGKPVKVQASRSNESVASASGEVVGIKLKVKIKVKKPPIVIVIVIGKAVTA